MNPLFFEKKKKIFLPFVKLNCHDNFHRVIRPIRQPLNTTHYTGRVRVVSDNEQIGL